MKLCLPVVMPSWRFFDVIAPSPRIEFSLQTHPNASHAVWQEFRPRAAHLSIGQMLWRLLYNPRWNESLFMVSCAERLMQHPTPHSEQQIITRIRTELARSNADVRTFAHLQFRLVFLHRHKGRITQHITFVSEPCASTEQAET